MVTWSGVMSNLDKISSEVDYIISSITNTEKNYNKFIEAYFSGDFKNLNLIKIKFNYDDYLTLIEKSFSMILYYIENKNHKKSREWINFFLDFYYIYKHHDINLSKQINNIFLEICSKYDSIFLKGEHKKQINNLKIDMNNFFNNEVNIYGLNIQNSFLDLNKSYNEIFRNFYGEKSDFNIKKIFNSLIKECYFIARKNKKIAKELYLELNRLVEFFLNNNLNSNVYYRILSFISLKNDILLQENLSIDQIEIYLNENKKFIKNIHWTDNGGETLQKLSENLIKIQFAYNLLGYKKNIQKEYLQVQAHLNENFNFFNIFKKKNDYIYNLGQYLLLTTAYVLFIDPGKISPTGFSSKIFYRYILFSIKFYKYKHYKFRGLFMFIYDLIFYKKYNFIY